MDTPDVELRMEYNDNGDMTKCSYFVNNREQDNCPIKEFIELIKALYQTSSDTFHLTMTDKEGEL